MILEKHGLLKCKKSEVDKISKPLIVNIQEGTYGAEILVNDKSACAKLYPEMVIEPATLEEIMIYYVNESVSSSLANQQSGNSIDIANQESVD